MAVELSTSEKQINYSEWNANGSGWILATCQYVRYEKINGSTARIYVRQCVKGISGIWTGSNSHYRSRGYNWEWDSGYGQWGSCETGWTQLWSGYFDVSDSNNHGVVCFCSTYGEIYYTQSVTYVYVPSSAFDSSPSGLSVSVVKRYKDGAKFNVKVNDWGRGATSNRYFEAAIMNHGSPYGIPYTFKHGTHGINAGVTEAITVTNNSKQGGSTITITPNTQYYYGAWATNNSTAAAISIIPGTLVTLADELGTKSAEVVGIHSIKINYTTKADGGKYAKKIQYSLDNSTWVNGATVSTGSATSGSFNITGLNAGTQYTIYLRISTDAGITTSGSVTAKTKKACKIIRGSSVIETIPYVIKPNGTKIELNIRRV